MKHNKILFAAMLVLAVFALTACNPAPDGMKPNNNPNSITGDRISEREDIFSGMKVGKIYSADTGEMKYYIVSNDYMNMTLLGFATQGTNGISDDILVIAREFHMKDHSDKDKYWSTKDNKLYDTFNHGLCEIYESRNYLDPKDTNKNPVIDEAFKGTTCMRKGRDNGFMKMTTDVILEDIDGKQTEVELISPLAMLVPEWIVRSVTVPRSLHEIIPELDMEMGKKIWGNEFLEEKTRY